MEARGKATTANGALLLLVILPVVGTIISAFTCSGSASEIGGYTSCATGDVGLAAASYLELYWILVVFGGFVLLLPVLFLAYKRSFSHLNAQVASGELTYTAPGYVFSIPIVSILCIAFAVAMIFFVF